MAESLGWIREAFRDIGRKLDHLVASNAEMKGMLVGHEEKLDEVRGIVFGADGSPGLKTEVDRLKQAMQTAQNSRRATWHWIEIVVGAAGGLISMAATGLAWWVFK